jgi:hypothetical protein
MKASEPPRVSSWLLERLAPTHKRESLIGDLREQYHEGRSTWWYRRQVLVTIAAAVAADISAHKLLAVRAFVLGCAAFFLLSWFYGTLHQALFIDRNLAPQKPELLRQALVYYGVPFEIIMCLGLAMTGWMIAKLHRDCRAVVVLLSALSPLLWAVPWARGTGRLLEAGLWPGWGWGSFRWALLFHAALLFVGYPVSILIGGLWHARRDTDLSRDGTLS